MSIPELVRSSSPGETLMLGRRIGSRLVSGDVIVLTGDLGAGKTLFAKGVAAGLGVVEPVTSPTFAIVQEYEGRLPVVHVDFYRVDSQRELFDIGLDETLDRDAVFLIEWGERFESVLPRRRLEVGIEAVRLSGGNADTADFETRSIRISSLGPAWEWLAEVLG